PAGPLALPLDPGRTGSIALLGAAARDPRVLGGGSATVFPPHVVSPLDGLRAVLPPGTRLTYAVGADPSGELAAAGTGFELCAVVRDADGHKLGGEPLPDGRVQWAGADFPPGVRYDELHTVEVTGTFTPCESGPHAFGTQGVGRLRLSVAGQVLFDGVQTSDHADVFEAFTGAPESRGRVGLVAGEPIEVSLVHTAPKPEGMPLDAVAFALLHREPERDSEELLAEAVAAAADADTAVVVVATTERVESEGFDRTSLALPGRQDELVRRVAAVNPHTVVVVNSGSPVELPWRDDVAAVLLCWFPGQEAGAALADVLLGAEEPGGRLPTTWPAALADAPVTRVTPENGELRYEEGVFIGYPAWERAGRKPAYCFGHGLGYTQWSYESIDLTTEQRAGAGTGTSGARHTGPTDPSSPGGSGAAGGSDPGFPSGHTVTVRLRNTGDRPGREVVQIYLSPADWGSGPEERPVRRLACFAGVEAGPGERSEVRIALPRRAFEIWDEESAGWRFMPGRYTVEAAHSVADRRLSAPLRAEG
ncbi:MAG TPA: glycosyl hydrolase, partial [Streptomyces sp.]|nr:glycosyl hydrolase [Streptomyces sp.]